MIQGPFDQGLGIYATGNWCDVDVESAGATRVMKDIQEEVSDSPDDVDLKAACHGSNLAALAEMWDDGVYALKT